jgi:hypothetical protein
MPLLASSCLSISLHAVSQHSLKLFLRKFIIRTSVKSFERIHTWLISEKIFGHLHADHGILGIISLRILSDGKTFRINVVEKMKVHISCHIILPKVVRFVR